MTPPRGVHPGMFLLVNRRPVEWIGNAMKTSRTTVLAVACAMLALVSLTGFTTVQPSGFLQDYHRLYHVGGVQIGRAHV